jgi:hypothetical protein
LKKSVAFLYIDNEHDEKEISKIISFTIVSKNIIKYVFKNYRKVKQVLFGNGWQQKGGV